MKQVYQQLSHYRGLSKSTNKTEVVPELKNECANFILKHGLRPGIRYVQYKRMVIMPDIHTVHDLPRTTQNLNSSSSSKTDVRFIWLTFADWT